MRLLIQHKSAYRYPRAANLGTHTLRLRPAAHAKAKIETYRLLVSGDHTLRWQQDPYGNHIAKVHFPYQNPIETLEILVELTAEVRPVNPFDFLLDELAETVPFAYPDELRRELAPFLLLDDPAFHRGERYREFSRALPMGGPTVPFITALNTAVAKAVRYVIREEAGVYTPEESLVAGQASCRDSAVLLTALFRERGLAARFVSGYLVQLTDEGMLPDQPKGVTRDVVDLHAWCEVYLPGGGWIGLDATSGLMTGEGHIPLCGASTPALASPLEGTADTAATEVSFSMVVGRLGHEARPTTPYTDEVWDVLIKGGDRVDAHLASHQIRLTMGGEPTFNARDHVELPEWNGAAIGPTKLAYGRRLVDELRRRMAPGAAVLHRPGKWYPGESLPRWALDICGRRDKTPLWPDRPTLAKRASDADAERFARALVRTLGLADDDREAPGLLPAFEDPLHAIKDEAQLPVDVDPTKVDLDDSEERRRLALTLSRGLHRPTGWVLPLAPLEESTSHLPTRGARWATDVWRFRRGALYLLPGDSAIGLRLPLASLGVGLPMPPLDEPRGYRPDPRGAKPDEDGDAQLAVSTVKPSATARYLFGIRTALCIEQRQGELYAFLPPLPSFARFSSLIACIDATRAVTGLDIHLEGYGPPSSPELFRFSVTPDPGVLEVNVPPTTSVREHDELLQQVFDAALAAGLHSEKYLVDGRLAGSGGGNHITFGGQTPLESPLLQRPDLLASLLTFFQHHPSLSYMFAGLFIGPTSQAPRVDEARHETLYELEIALERAFASRQLDGPEGPPPWLSDLLFRHLLVDLTGNTHRAEICIDKLFDPHTPYGRQGLIELRAFEMPPHPRMVTAQVLLVRALIASFVGRPYHHPLVRWGQALHDRFLLPHNLWRDFEDVLGHLSDAGLPLPADGYRPFLELRCPLVGTLQAGDITLEVRNALEPWHVLGEEMSTSGTARYVDSSLERIEVRATGLTPNRHAVLVNGHTLPLYSTPSGAAVAGVRFRAWAPAHALHAHIGVHHPIRLEVVDTWSQRSLGGCAYHVWHPEGRAYDTPPLTRFEAAARRAQRFTIDSHTPWPVVPRPAAMHADQPWTLDLRRLPLDRMPHDGPLWHAHERPLPRPMTEETPR
jgi:uncharacterized protein (DUF2126 family)